MAVARMAMCSKCSTKFTAFNTDMSPDVCSACKKTDDEVKEKAHFNELDKLTLEERIRKLEKWSYNHKCNTGFNPLDRY